jgi:hypothetical protein
MEESAPYETKEDRNVFPTDRKRTMMVIHLDWLAPYQGATHDERPSGGSNMSS